MGFKKHIRNIHKWLGLTSGLIVFIVAVTGCIFCFHDEIKDLTRKEYRFVEPQDKPYLAPSKIRANALKVLPEGAKVWLIGYTGKDRSCAAFSQDKSGEWIYVYFNPYTGRFLKSEIQSKDFFIIVEYIHLYLLLPDYIGKHIVGGATLIFIVLLITGIIQWWPKKRKNLKERLGVKWSAKWRRVNYDWHNVSGFYVAIIALIVAISGLHFAYEWVGDGLYYTANLGKGDRQKEVEHPAIDTTAFTQNRLSVSDYAMHYTMKKHPDHQMFWVTFPDHLHDPVETGAYPISLRYDRQSNYHFHPDTGAMLKADPYERKSAGLKLVEMCYGIHTGQILSLPGKILAFTASLICAALPVTGFVIWWGRRNKKKPAQKHKKKMVAQREPELVQ